MAVLCIFLLIACYYDYRYRRVPNWLMCGILTVGVARCIVMQDKAIFFFFLNMIFLICLLYPFFRLGTLGAGDVKLFGVCGGYLTSDRILYFLFFSLLIAAIFSLIKLVTQRNIKERFLYIGDYLWDVVRTGRWRLYMDNEKERYRAGIPLSGPILCSVILYMGGVY